MKLNKRALVALSAAAAIGGTTLAASAAPVSKQNGSLGLTPFSTVCGPMPGYGLCNGDPTTFSTVTGKIDAVQAKAGRYNMGFSFTGLQPGATYRLWENLNGSFTPLGDLVADSTGKGQFSWQYFAQPGDKLGFDLNVDPTNGYGTTVVTSYWTGAVLSPSGPDGLIAAT